MLQKLFNVVAFDLFLGGSGVAVVCFLWVSVCLSSWGTETWLSANWVNNWQNRTKTKAKLQLNIIDSFALMKCFPKAEKNFNVYGTKGYFSCTFLCHLIMAITNIWAKTWPWESIPKPRYLYPFFCEKLKSYFNDIDEAVDLCVLRLYFL